MLTLYHAPQTRSSRIVTLLKEMDAVDRVTIRTVLISRQDGSGGADSANPHPEGKVPVLDHDGAVIWESNAIALYLTDLFPDAGLGPAMGDPMRGPYLSWLAYYGNVIEPVMHFSFFGIDEPPLRRTFRGTDEMNARVSGALQGRPFLLGEAYSAADLFVSSAYAFMPALLPEDGSLRAWSERCQSRPALAWTAEFDAKQGG